jgi:hypothetical protein
VTQTIPARSLTVNGERTRAKIVDSAAILMLNDGVARDHDRRRLRDGRGREVAGVPTTSMTRRNWFGL